MGVCKVFAEPLVLKELTKDVVCSRVMRHCVAM